MSNSLQARGVPGFSFLKDGIHYTRLESGTIKKYNLLTGEFVNDVLSTQTLKDKFAFEGNIESYSFSEDESQILISTKITPMYRHSSKAITYVYQVNPAKFTKLFDGKSMMQPSFSPDGEHVAFVFENNLYIHSLKSNKTTAITKDGKVNAVLNGIPDWVYEEEFSFSKAYEWAPDGKKIAFIRFDESSVPQFTMMRYSDEMYPIYETFKYPKVGEKNAEVKTFIYHVANKKTVQAQIGDLTDMYIPRIKWTNNPNQLCVTKLNRHQNHLQLYFVDAKSGKASVALEEKNQYYIDIHDDLRFLKDGTHFIWSSEKGGYQQLYLYDMQGIEKRNLTPGKYDVLKFYGVDEKNGKIYFQAALSGPETHVVCTADLNGSKASILANAQGVNNATFSPTFEYFVNNHSTINTPPNHTVYDRSGKALRTIEDNKTLITKMEELDLAQAEFFTFKTSENVTLHGWMIKPTNFNPNRSYPVFQYQYGGPGSQQVTDGWKGANYWWFQHLAQQGYIIVCVDNRGTGARGEEFKKMTYLQLGHYETIDQIETAKYMASLPYVDGSRIGIFGWSYGGYMASNCILKGNDVFKAAIAVAPVTNWKWYDTIYTERYMRTLEENKKGYYDNSPIYFADRLKGAYLLVHGEADDNVHYQHTAEMALALIKANKQYDTYIYPNRNHGIYGDNARIHLYTKMTNFILEKI